MSGVENSLHEFTVLEGAGQIQCLLRLLAPSSPSTLLPWSEILIYYPASQATPCPTPHIFLAQANVGKDIHVMDQDRSVRTVSTSIEDKVRVIDRMAHVWRVSEVTDPKLLTTAVRANVLQHLYLLHLLEIGDYGTHNMLMTNAGAVVGIDHEERRQPQSNSCTVFEALIKKGGSKQQRELYKDYLHTITQLQSSMLDSSNNEKSAVVVELEAAGANVKRILELAGAFKNRKLM